MARKPKPEEVASHTGFVLSRKRNRRRRSIGRGHTPYFSRYEPARIAGKRRGRSTGPPTIQPPLCIEPPAPKPYLIGVASSSLLYESRAGNWAVSFEGGSWHYLSCLIVSSKCIHIHILPCTLHFKSNM
jgi:hypothetical protein